MSEALAIIVEAGIPIHNVRGTVQSNRSYAEAKRTKVPGSPSSLVAGSPR